MVIIIDKNSNDSMLLVLHEQEIILIRKLLKMKGVLRHNITFSIQTRDMQILNSRRLCLALFMNKCMILYQKKLATM